MKTRFMKKSLFKNREEAARLLAQNLAPLGKLKPLVLGVPRGGVPMAKILADILGGDLDVVLVHRIAVPGNEEYALGAVSERGLLYTAPYAQHFNISKEYLEEEVKRQVGLLADQRRLYTPHRPAISAANRVVLIVDDGMVTGATALAAMREVEAQHPAEVVVATAVAQPEAVELLKEQADEVVALEVNQDFKGLSELFKDFPKVSDEEVVRIFRYLQSPVGG
jgi:predicted phosphoribosyltransferase